MLASLGHSPKSRSLVSLIMGAVSLVLVHPFPSPAQPPPSNGRAASRSHSRQHPPIVSPDVPLEFVTSAFSGGGPQVVLTSPLWTILLDYHQEIYTDTDGPRIRKLYRRPAAGGDLEEIWDDSRFGPVRADGADEMPHVWLVYDDGAVLFSRGAELTYLPRAGARHRWVSRLGGEEWLPVYADTSGIVLRPNDFTHGREAYFVPGERDAFDLDRRIRITGAAGLRFPEPLFKRHGNLLTWLDWPSYDVPGSTLYRLSLFDLQARKGWSNDLQIAGNPRLEQFDGRTIQVSGKRYDARTGKERLSRSRSG